MTTLTGFVSPYGEDPMDIRGKNSMISVVAGLVLLFAPDVNASPPCECDGNHSWILPTDYFRPLPTNVRFIFNAPGSFGWTHETYTGKLLKLPESTEVPIYTEHAGYLDYQFWVIPELELEPNSSYNLGGYEFKTGSSPDGVPPVYDSVVIQGTQIGGACQEHLAAEVVFQGLYDDRTHEDIITVRLDIVDPSSKGGIKTIYVRNQRSIFGNNLGSWDNCLYNFPDAERSLEYTAMVTAIDAGGNESITSEPIQFKFQHNERFGVGLGCGCGMGDSAPNAWLLCLLSGILVWLMKEYPREHL